MLAIERKNKIFEILRKDGRVLVNNLSTMFGVTEETIRRDLEKLEKEGVAKKSYGGAILVENANVDLPYIVRKEAHVQGKEYIAEVISNLIEDGDRIMLDASSTAVFVARCLKNKKNLTVITNSIEILIELSEIDGWKIFSTGGTLREGSLSLVGYQAEKMISTYHVDKAIFSCKGIDMEKGITDSNEMDAHIKNLMIGSANRKILAVDSSKFGKISFTKIDDFKEIDLVVTDLEPEEIWKSKFENENVQVLY